MIEEHDSYGHYWDAVIDRLLKSKHPLEREHLLFGTHAEYGYPVLVHKPIVEKHVHFQGGSGTGKTSRGFAPMEVQLIRAGENVAMLDLKGEMFNFETVRIECARCERTFKWFTNVL